MNNKELLKVFQNKKFVVIGRRIPHELAVDIVEAIHEGGVCLFESTFDQALEDPISANKMIISTLCRKFGTKMFIGTGTVLTVEQVQASYEAGATFILSPNTNMAVIAETKRLGMLSIAGAMTPTEVVMAHDSGADIVKLFPADDLGFHFIRSLRGPLPHIPLLVSGGVNPQTIPRFFESGIDYVSTGITILKPELIKIKNYKEITRLAKEHVEAVEESKKRMAGG